MSLVFGERGHVRFYGLDLQDRLQDAGFEVRLDPASEVPLAVRKRFDPPDPRARRRPSRQLTTVGAIIDDMRRSVCQLSNPRGIKSCSPRKLFR